MHELEAGFDYRQKDGTVTRVTSTGIAIEAVNDPATLASFAIDAEILAQLEHKARKENEVEHG